MTAPPGQVLADIRAAVGSVVVGQEEAVDRLLVAMLCRGHALLEDAPGMGKTLLARTLAAVSGCDFRRVQFTPDVLPSDVTGSMVFNQRTSDFEFRPGPVFTQVLLADEINRATPRSQSALLEAMEERQVTVDGETMKLPDPFLVLATQNPVELEGTFPLPEAQLDRFLLKISLGYPSVEDEAEILRRFERDEVPSAPAVVDADGIAELQRARAEVTVGDTVRGYLLELVRATRDDERTVLGASPRASLALHRATQAEALLRGRAFALPDDVKAMAPPVLAHRLIPTASARLRGETPEGILAEILERQDVPVEPSLAAPSASA